jgi:hypothetical protein
MFLFKQVIGMIGTVAGNYFEKQFGPAREHSYARWKDRIATINMLLDADPKVQEKISRLMASLHQQGRHEDLMRFQQFLTALDEPQDEGPVAAVVSAVAGIMGKSTPREASAHDRILLHLAGLIGETGTDADLTEAVRFLEGNRVIGFPMEKHEKGGIQTKIAHKLKEISQSLDNKAAWFQSHTRSRRRRQSLSTPS